MAGLGTKNNGKTKLKGVKHSPITSDIKSEILIMHREGVGAERIAEMLHVSPRVVKRILRGRE